MANKDIYLDAEELSYYMSICHYPHHSLPTPPARPPPPPPAPPLAAAAPPPAAPPPHPPHPRTAPSPGTPTRSES